MSDIAHSGTTTPSPISASTSDCPTLTVALAPRSDHGRQPERSSIERQDTPRVEAPACQVP